MKQAKVVPYNHTDQTAFADKHLHCWTQWNNNPSRKHNMCEDIKEHINLHFLDSVKDSEMDRLLIWPNGDV